MKFAAVHRAFLLTSPGIDVSNAVLGAWLRVYCYACADGIEMPVLEEARRWRDRDWLMRAQVTAAEVEAMVEAGMGAWDGQDLIVFGYDDTGATKIKTLRENGKFGGLGGRPSTKKPPVKPDAKPSGLKSPNPLTLPYPTLPNQTLPHPPGEDLARSHEDVARAPAAPGPVNPASGPSGEAADPGGSAAPAAAPPLVLIPPPVLVYQCNGPARTWPLSRQQIQEWQGLFPGVDVERECRAALAWSEANKAKRKTAKGMPRFLVAWLTRSNDRGGNRQAATNGNANGVGHFKATAATNGTFKNGRVI